MNSTNSIRNQHSQEGEMGKKVPDLLSEPQQGEIIVYRSDDGRIKIDVRLQDETVWLTQQLIAELFQTKVPNNSMHIRNTFDEGELTPEATIKKLLTVCREVPDFD